MSSSRCSFSSEFLFESPESTHVTKGVMIRGKSYQFRKIYFYGKFRPSLEKNFCLQMENVGKQHSSCLLEQLSFDNALSSLLWFYMFDHPTMACTILMRLNESYANWPESVCPTWTRINGVWPSNLAQVRAQGERSELHLRELVDPAGQPFPAEVRWPFGLCFRWPFVSKAKPTLIHHKKLFGFLPKLSPLFGKTH